MLQQAFFNHFQNTDLLLYTLLISSAYLHAIIQLEDKYLFALEIYCYIFYMHIAYGLSTSVIDEILGKFLPTTFFKSQTRRCPGQLICVAMWGKYFLQYLVSFCLKSVFSIPFLPLHWSPTSVSDSLISICKTQWFRISLYVSQIIYVKRHQNILASSMLIFIFIYLI